VHVHKRMNKVGDINDSKNEVDVDDDNNDDDD